MKIGVYVGSFDPVHKAHMEVVNHVTENNYVDKVVIIPTHSYWNKKQLTDIKNRIAMLKFYENNNIIINTTLNSVPYTYQILNALKEQYQNDELYLIIGADNIEKFHLWKEVDKILENKILVLPRNRIDVYKYIEKFKQKKQFIFVENFNVQFISSTAIRNMILTDNYQEINGFLDENVLKYILDNNLYKN